jgi:hypothetical protein
VGTVISAIPPKVRKFPVTLGATRSSSSELGSESSGQALGSTVATAERG